MASLPPRPTGPALTALALAVAAAVLGGGCQPTGVLVEITAPASSPRVAALDLWFFGPRGEPGAGLEPLPLTTGGQVNFEGAGGRDLGAAPYRLFVETEVAETPAPMTVVVVGASVDGQLLSGVLTPVDLVEGRAVLYRVRLQPTDAPPELALGREAVGFCRLQDELGLRFVALCDDACDCDDVLEPGCGYARGGDCGDFDGDGCPDEMDLDPLRPSEACGVCQDGAPCSLEGCPGLLQCRVGPRARPVCRVDTQADECGGLACPAPDEPALFDVVDDAPCFVQAGGTGPCVQGTRACDAAGAWQCRPDRSAPADPVLCPLHARCETALTEGETDSPGRCLTEADRDLDPPLVLGARRYDAARLVPASGCNGCQLDVQLAPILATLLEAQDLGDPEDLTCCVEATNATLTGNLERCGDDLPTQGCAELVQTGVTVQAAGTWYLAIDVTDGDRRERLVLALQAAACEPSSGPETCTPAALDPEAP